MLKLPGPMPKMGESEIRAPAERQMISREANEDLESGSKELAMRSIFPRMPTRKRKKMPVKRSCFLMKDELGGSDLGEPLREEREYMYSKKRIPDASDIHPARDRVRRRRRSIVMNRKRWKNDMARVTGGCIRKRDQVRRIPGTRCMARVFGELKFPRKR